MSHLETAANRTRSCTLFKIHGFKDTMRKLEKLKTHFLIFTVYLNNIWSCFSLLCLKLSARMNHSHKDTNEMLT